MKSILLSIKPEWLVKILNGEKTIEVRKLFRKDYVGWVYIYCSKSKPLLFDKNKNIYFTGKYVNTNIEKHNANSNIYANAEYELFHCKHLEGKVVARFWCYKVEEIRPKKHYDGDFMFKTCLWSCEINNYLKGKVGYAIYISDLEIFDKPRELEEFKRYHEPSEHSACWKCKRFGTGCVSCSITKAPQNYCYIKGE